MPACLIGLGSNQGDRLHNLLAALAALRGRDEIRVSAVSSFYLTAPVGGPPGQADYLNAAAVLSTDLPAEDLHAILLAVEAQLGRTRGERWGPRTIDLDLLLYGDAVIQTPHLNVPHPRLDSRRFVLAPAAEIAPSWRHPPSDQTIGQLLNELPTTAGDSVIMRVITSPSSMQEVALNLRRAGRRVGLIPTMGALHAGHLSLIQMAKQKTDATIATIFVNPTQFGPREDFGKYPRTLDDDLTALSAAGCDFVFVPAVADIYTPNFSTYVDPPKVAEPLEGVCRPGHFRGVATVVLKLFQLIPADLACFGQKDYQQLLVIRHMVQDLAIPVEIVACPTIREPDGLALSSRNRYLSPAERQQALALSRALTRAEQLAAAGEREAAKVTSQMRRILQESGIDRVDYVAIANRETLQELSHLDQPAVALIAAHVGATRLIDNRLLTAPLNPEP